MNKSVTIPNHDHDHYTESGEHIISHELKLSVIGSWLARGWADMMATPIASMFYGIMMWLFVMLTLSTYMSQPIMMFTVATAFIMIAPFLATGLYSMAHQIEMGEKPDLITSMFSWRKNLTNFALFAVILGTIIAIWGRITPLIAAIVASDDLLIVRPEQGIEGILFSATGQEFLLAFGVGAILVSALVFAISVVTIPLMLRDRKVGVVNAMIVSFQVTIENKGLMVAWALTIGVMLLAGIATMGIAMLIVMPLLGYASWHAFTDLVDIEGIDQNAPFK